MLQPRFHRRSVLGVFLCVCATLGLAVRPAQAQSGRATLPAGVRRVLFLGDSITYAGDYVSFVEAYFVTRYPDRRIEFMNAGLPSETVSGLSEPGHADGKFPRPDLHERLARVLAKTKPDFVFADYGMNDAIYMPLDKERFQKFKDGIEWLNQQITAAGAKIVFVTPSTFDGKGKNNYYNGVLDHYSDWLLKQRSKGWDVVALHGGMNRWFAEQRKKDPAYSFSGDGVHPNRLGHWIMAKQILLHLGGEDIAHTPDAEAMVAGYPNGLEVLKLVEQREAMMKDAWLTAAGHKRPGMKKGLPLDEALAKNKVMEARIYQLAQGKK